MPQNGNFMDNASNNNYYSNRNPQSNNGLNPTKPYQQSSPNQYEHQQQNRFLIQQSEPPTQVMR
jgi:hypothetical protein